MHGGTQTGTTEHAPVAGANGSGDPSGAARARRLARRGPALPSGRAVVGGLLVATSMVTVFVAASGATRGPSGRAVVAARPMPIGHRIEADDVRLESVEVPTPSAGRLFTSPGSLVGAVTTAPLDADDLIDRSAVVEPGADPSGGHEFSFPLERERAVNGHLQPGETIDLLATYGTGETAHTDVVARHVRLLDIEDASKATIGSTGKVVVTLALDSDDDVVRAAHATEVAAIVLVRSEP